MSIEVKVAEAINLSQPGATVLLPASDLAAILTEVRSLRAEFETFREQSAEDRARDCVRIKALEVAEPQPRQKDRGEILIALLAANKGKMFAKDARHKLEMSETAFSLLLKTHSDKIASKPYFDDRRRHVIELK